MKTFFQNRSTRTLLILVVFAGLVSVLAACGGSDDDEGASSDEPITIGVVTSDTGDAAAYDVPTRIGVEMAVRDLNEDGGVLDRELEIASCDSRSEASQNARCGEDVLSQGAKFIMSTGDFDLGSPAATLAQERDVITFAAAGSPKFGPSGIGPNAFTIIPLTNVEAAVAAEWGYEKQGWRTAYLMTDTTLDYTKTMAEYFKTRWSELAGADALLGEDTFRNEDTSFASQVSQLQATDPAADFIFIPSCPPGGAALIRQIRGAGIETPIITNVCFAGDGWLGAVPNLDNYYDFAELSAFGDDPSPQINKFFDEVNSQIDEGEAAFFAASGYSSLEAWAKAVEEVGNPDDGAAIVETLEGFENEPLLVGETTFGAVHAPQTREFRILSVQGGTHHVVDEWTAEEPPPIEGP